MSSLFTKLIQLHKMSSILLEENVNFRDTWCKNIQNYTVQKYKMLSSSVSYSVLKHFEDSSPYTSGILGGKLYSDSLINMINRWDWNRNFLKAFQNKDRTVACVDVFLTGPQLPCLETGHYLQFKLLSQSFWPLCF